jgi:ABC-2 type transport system ATP-binding protein
MLDPTVEAVHLYKAFGAHRVIEDLSFAVMPGEVVGVLGKNGAGKTTLLELVLGYTLPTEGEVRVFGHASQRMPGAAKRRVGFVPQVDELLDSLTVRDQLRVIASFYPHWDGQLIDRLCGEWGIEPRVRIKSMSIGERQKLSILLAFGHRPDLLILDEPVASLDPLARRQFLEQLVELSADGERAVVFSSHIVSDIERLANRIWIHRATWRGGRRRAAFPRGNLRGAAPVKAVARLIWSYFTCTPALRALTFGGCPCRLAIPRLPPAFIMTRC